ncbi:hypothetical protein K440DRAFT_639113 [Wilcoxina mikolae CBS 423.85]|nr:hypothetical protein K440DRAFT_639113 [Wilcoxina mikolae CBS 423.85]
MPPPPPAFALDNTENGDANRSFVSQLQDFGSTSHDQHDAHKITPNIQQHPENDWMATLLDLQRQHSNLIAQQQANLALQSHLQRQINFCLATRSGINRQNTAHLSGQEFSYQNAPVPHGSGQEFNGFTIPHLPDCFGPDETLGKGYMPHPQSSEPPLASPKFRYDDEVQGDNSIQSMMRSHDASRSIKENFAAYKSVRKQIPPPIPFQPVENYDGFQRRSSIADGQHLTAPNSAVIPPSPTPMEIDNPYLSQVENALADDVRRLIETLPRESLQSVIFKTLTDNSLSDIQRGKIRRHIMDSFQRIPSYHDLVKNPEESLQWATLLTANGGQFKTVGSMGTFSLPVECIANVLRYLPLKDVLTLLLGTCRSLRALFGHMNIWSNVTIDSRGGSFGVGGFRRLLRRLPETSIRKLTIDTTPVDMKKAQDILEVLVHKKQWNITSLHIVGKKATQQMLTLIIRRLWSESIKVLSVHDVPTATDGNLVTKCIVSYLPNLKRLRLEGTLDTLSLKQLSGLRAGPERARTLGDNRITHLSFAGPKSTMDWENIATFGELFPELEELFVACIPGSGEGKKWEKKWGIPQTGASKSGAASGINYRHPTPAEINWTPMLRLRYFAVEHIAEPISKKEAKVQENIHTAYLWALINGSKDTLERLEINRGEEKIPTDGKGKGHWHIPWHCFVGVYDPVPNHQPEPAHLIMPNIKTVVFYKCEGLPTSAEEKEKGAQKQWISELRNILPNVEGWDETVGKMALARNAGAGGW